MRFLYAMAVTLLSLGFVVARGSFNRSYVNGQLFGLALFAAAYWMFWLVTEVID